MPHSMWPENERSYTVRDLLRKSDKDTLNMFKQILLDLAKIYYNQTWEMYPKNIISFQKYVMSDKTFTEKKFSELLQEYRKEILSRVMDKWDQLSSEVLENIAQIHHFTVLCMS